jgi:PAS domain S-box-containing protein
MSGPNARDASGNLLTVLARGGAESIKRLRLSEAATVGFALALFVLVIGGAIGFANVRWLDSDRRMVSHTHEVIALQEALWSTLKDAETGQRGFLLTGEEKYLEPYNEALQRVRSQFTRLKELTSDNPDQQARLVRLDQGIKSRLELLKQVIEVAKSGDQPAAVEIVRGGAGKVMMDALRREIGELKHAEHELLAKRAGEAATGYITTLWSILVTSLVGIVLVGLAFLLTQRNTRQRQQAAEVLAEQKERLRTTLASIGDGVMSTDHEGNVTYLNAVSESLTGWTNADAVGVPLTTVFHIVNESTRQPVENPALRALREGIIVGLANHTILIARDGTERPIDDSAAPIRCRDGEIVGCVLVFRDVTERKREEDARAERARLFELRADIGTALTADRSTAVALKHACEALVRHLDVAFARIWTLDELEHDHLNGETPVLELQASAGLYTHLDGPHSRVPVGQFKIGRIASLRQPHLSNSVSDDPEVSDPDWAREMGMVAFAGYPLIVADRVVGVVAMFARRPLSEGVLTELEPLADVIAQFVDRKQTEGRLRQSEERFRTLFNSMDEGFCVIEMIFDAAGSPTDYRFVETNPAFEKHTGLADAAGKRVRELVPDHDAHWFDIYGKVAVTGEPIRFVNHAKALDDRWFDVYAFRFGGAAHRKVAVLFNDITERKRMEDDLRQLAADLSEGDRRKDEFLAMLAHELRNPLAPIRNGLQVMRLAKDNEEEVERSRSMMERQLDQMVRLVDDLMDVSRISRGKLELKLEKVVLAKVVESAVETSRPLIDQMGHELTVNQPGDPIHVVADFTRLAQVFLNLLNNAAKYSERGGNILLHVERQGSEVLVSVLDEGIGIDAEHLPRIFDLFSQVDRSLEKSQGGLGIGLTLVRRLVEMHGGRVEARSEGPGRGSEFHVFLPVMQEVSAIPAPGRVESSPLPKLSLRILIVDDNRDSADSLAMMLKIMGNTIRTAYDGQEAVSTADTFQPDVILLDIGLPKLNGYEACRRIREQSAGRKIFIIAQTGWGQEEDRQRTHDAGFDLHMVKPVDPMKLKNLLTDLAHGAKRPG